MSKLAAVAVAAGLFAAVPAFISSAQAEPAVSVRVGDGYHHGWRDHGWRHARACEKKVIIRNGHKTVIKRCD
jgi:hypothetical protein